MAADKTKLTTGKPKVGGGIYAAPAGTTLPTDATTALAEAFKCLGYVSEDGVKNSRENDEEIKAWGGEVVLRTMTDKFNYTLIEAMNIDVLKHVYGADNVSGTLADGIVIMANDVMQEEGVLVFDMMFREGVLKRIVVPRAQVVEVGEVSYTDGEVVGYETTLQANGDDDGNTHYEYIQTKPAASGNGG